MTGSADGAIVDGRPTEALSLRELFDLNAYWLAINILWGAIGISLLPILMVDLVCGGKQACGTLTPILPGLSVGQGQRPRRSSSTSGSSSRSSSSRPSPRSATTPRAGSAGGSRTSSSGPCSTWSSSLGFYLAGAWIGVLVFYCLLQFSSNFAQGPFQGYMPDLVPGQAGRTGERPHGPDDPARGRRRGDARGGGDRDSATPAT